MSRTDYMLLSIAALCLVIAGVAFLPLTYYDGLLGILGVVIGVVVGVVIEYQLRRRGELHIQARPWASRDPERGQAARRFEIRCFNERDVGISLWDARVEFYQGDKRLDSIPAERADSEAEVGPIDLEFRKSVYLEMMVVAESEEMLSRLESADRVEFVATTIPDGGQVRKALTAWNDIDDPQ
jgi:hypothetical protein